MLSPKHRALVAELPLDRLLTETDGPFVEAGGRPARPHDVVKVIAELARVRGGTEDEMARVVVSNLAAIVSN